MENTRDRPDTCLMPPDYIYNQWVRGGQKQTGKAWKAVVYTGEQLPDQWSPSNFTTDLSKNNFTNNATGSYNGTGSGDHTSKPFDHEDQVLLNKTYPLSRINKALQNNGTSDSETQSGVNRLAKRTFGNMLSDAQVVQFARNQNLRTHHVAMGDSKAEIWRRQDQHDGHSYPMNSGFLSTAGLCGCMAIVLWSPNAVMLAHVREASADPATFGPWWINYPPTQAEQRHLDGIFIQEAQALVEQWVFQRDQYGQLLRTPPDVQKDARGRTIRDSHGRPRTVPGTGGRLIWDERKFPKQSTEAIIIAPHKNVNYQFHTDPSLTQEPTGQPMPNDWFHRPQVQGVSRLFYDWGIQYQNIRYYPRNIGPGRNQAHLTDSRDIVLLNIEENSSNKRNLEIRLYYDGQRSGQKMPLGRDRSPSPQQQGSGSGGGGH